MKHTGDARKEGWTQEDLPNSAVQLRAILETAVEGIITIDQHGIIESFNPSAEKIFGYQAVEAVGQNVKILMSEPYRDEHDGYVENYHRTSRPKIIGIGREVVGRRKDGTVFPMDLSVSEMRLADRRKFAGFVRDITDRKAGEKALLHYAALVESSDDAIIGKTLDGHITSWNKGAEAIFGFKREDALGKHISIIIPPDREAEEQMILEKIGRGESVEHYQTVRQRKDGQLVDISVTISPIRESGGRIIGASKLARDITERIRLEKEILEISEREQRRIGSDLHDGLCQELAGVEMMCQVLEQKLAAKSVTESKQAGEITRHIREAIAHTRNLARGLSPVDLDVNGFMSALHELVASVQKFSRLECRLEFQKPVLIRNNIFATHLYRVAQESINNAVKHGQAKRVVISLKSTGNKTTLTIADDGIGFSNESKGCAGMGLNIMKYRAGVVGAALDVRSVVGSGTTVLCVFNKNL